MSTTPTPFPALPYVAAQLRKDGDASGNPTAQAYAHYVASHIEWLDSQSGTVMTLDPIFAYGLVQIALKPDELAAVERMLPRWKHLQRVAPCAAAPAELQQAADPGLTPPPVPPPATPPAPAPPAVAAAPQPAPSPAAARVCPATGASCSTCAVGVRCAELPPLAVAEAPRLEPRPVANRQARRAAPKKGAKVTTPPPAPPAS